MFKKGLVRMEIAEQETKEKLYKHLTFLHGGIDEWKDKDHDKVINAIKGIKITIVNQFDNFNNTCYEPSNKYCGFECRKLQERNSSIKIIILDKSIKDFLDKYHYIDGVCNFDYTHLEFE